MQTLKLTKKYEQYPEYKDSGVEWLGDVPKNWNVDIIQHLFTKVKRLGFGDEELLSVYRDRGVIIKSSRDDNHNKASEDLSLYQLVNKGDLAINKMKAWQGSIAVSEYKGIVSPAYFICKPLTKNDSRFMHYLLRSDVYIKQYERNSGGVRNDQWDLDYERFRKLKIAIPEIVEQIKIAKYLDQKTVLIDQIVEKKEKQIELVTEKFLLKVNFLINNVEGKKNKLKFVSRLDYGNTLPSEIRTDGSVKVYGSNGPVGTHHISNTLAPVVIVGRKGSYGVLNYSDEEVFAIDTTYYIDQRSTKENLKWLYYALSTVKLDTLSQDTGVPGLSRSTAYEKFLNVPTLNDQEKVVSKIDAEVLIYNKNTDLLKKSIDHLKEFKVSLISNVVTGKIKV